MFYKTINIIKLNLNLKNKIFKTKFYKNEFEILNIFIKLNIIKNIKLYKNNEYFVCLNINNPFKNIKNLYKSSNINTITLKNLKIINKIHNRLFYLSTTKGIINNFEAEKNKIGGVLIMNI